MNNDDKLRSQLEDVFCFAHTGLREVAKMRNMTVLEYVADSIDRQIDWDTSRGREDACAKGFDQEICELVRKMRK